MKKQLEEVIREKILKFLQIQKLETTILRQEKDKRNIQTAQQSLWGTQF